MLKSHAVNKPNCCLSYSGRRNTHVKVGNVCTPSFSILYQRCELFIRGRASTHSLHTCRICVASESLPSCLGLPPLHLLPGTRSQPWGAREGGHVLWPPEGARMRPALTSPTPPRKHFREVPSSWVSDALAAAVAQKKRTSPSTTTFFQATPEQQVCSPGLAFVVTAGWGQSPKGGRAGAEGRGVTMGDHREQPGPQAQLTSSAPGLQKKARRG